LTWNPSGFDTPSPICLGTEVSPTATAVGPTTLGPKKPSAPRGSGFFPLRNYSGRKSRELCTPIAGVGVKIFHRPSATWTMRRNQGSGRASSKAFPRFAQRCVEKPPPAWSRRSHSKRLSPQKPHQSGSAGSASPPPRDTASLSPGTCGRGSAEWSGLARRCSSNAWRRFCGSDAG
jgi:hypothetical protein